MSGCGGDDDAQEGTEAGGDKPVYALMTQVYGPEDRTVYVWLSHTLDAREVNLDEAREYGGVANFNVIDGRLLVSSGESPTITAYEISDKLEWTEVDSVSFADYPLQDNANWYYQFVLNDQTAYLPFEGYKRLVWNPAELVIEGVEDDSMLNLEMGNLQLEAGGNRNGVRYDETVYQAFFYHDEDWYDFADQSLIVAYDPETHAEEEIVEAPCPGLALATRDEDDRTYFSTWDYGPGRALFGDGPAPCAVRLESDGSLDDDFTTDFTDVTDGRFVMNFRYIGNGKAVANVLHDEELDIDREGPVDPEVIDNLWQSGPHWRIWMFDVEEGSASPVEGVDVEVGSGAQFAVLDGRTFVFVPFDDWSRSKVYELGADGAAHEHFEVEGDVAKWMRVR